MILIDFVEKADRLRKGFYPAGTGLAIEYKNNDDEDIIMPSGSPNNPNWIMKDNSMLVKEFSTMIYPNTQLAIKLIAHKIKLPQYNFGNKTHINFYIVCNHIKCLDAETCKKCKICHPTIALHDADIVEAIKLIRAKWVLSNLNIFGEPRQLSEAEADKLKEKVVSQLLKEK